MQRSSVKHLLCSEFVQVSLKNSKTNKHTTPVAKKTRRMTAKAAREVLKMKENIYAIGIQDHDVKT